MNDIVALSKRRGFIFPGSEVYGGIRGFWDYGPLGVELKNNIKREWWRSMVYGRDDVVGMDTAIIMNPEVWSVSGHLNSFTDPLVECKMCHKRFRADKKELLLPTVLSRCAQARFNLLPVSVTRDILLDQTDISKDAAEFLAYFTQGSPGAALELVAEGFEEYRSSIIDMIGRVAEEDNSVCLNWENETRDELLKDIEILIGFFRDVAVSKEGMSRLALDKHITDSTAYKVFSQFSISRIYFPLSIISGPLFIISLI